MTNTGHAHPRVAAAIAGTGREAAPRPAEHRLPRARAAAVRPAAATLLPGGPWQAFLSNSGAEAVEAAVKLARVATGRPAIMAFRYGFHGRTAQTMALTDGQGRLPRRVRAAAGLRLPHGLPVLLPGRRRRPRPDGLHLRLGGAARPDVPPAHLPGQGRGDHHRAGPRRGRLHRPAARRSCRGCARSPASTASCSSPTRSRPGSGGPARCSPSSTGTSSPTSSSWPRASRPGCRCRGSSPGRELMAALEAGHPRRHVRRQRRRRAPRRTRRSTSSRTRASSPTPASAARQFLAGLRALAGRYRVDRRRARARADGRDRARQARRGRRPGARSRPDQADPGRGARAQAASS